MIHSRAIADTSLEEHQVCRLLCNYEIILLCKYVCQSVDEMPPLKKKALKRTKRVGYYLHIT